VADVFAVDPEAIADALDRMTEFQRVAEGLLTEIDTTVKNLHVTWSGEAAAGHAEAHERWSRGAAMMREALGQLHTAGTDARGNYTGAISANQKMWST
jgi:WXG100 family type VII secretion target